MSSFLSTASVRGAARAFLITGLWLSLLLLSFRLTGSTFLSQSNVAFMESHLLGGMLALGLAIFLITFGKFQPLKAIFSIASSRKDGDRGRLVINVGLSLAVILIVVALVTSLYQTVTSAPKSDSNLWRDPEVIAVAIGLILSVLFVDRWRSLEGKVDGLASDQSSRLKDIQQFSTDQIELKVGQVVDKAEKVSAKLASISEQNPWLEVVTERDIILETESVRGILRSAYNLLNEDKTLHLFEYLDFSSRKGTDADPRKQKVPLRGTADDFLEIASFCEIWLGDYALAVEFLHRYINQAGKAAYVIYPDLTRRLLRNGDLPRAKQQMVLLERVVRRQQIKRVLPFLDSPQPVSERYYWHACNVLAIAHAAIGSRNLAVRYSTEASAHSCASLFATDQILFQAERLIYEQNFVEALMALEKLADYGEEEDSAFSTLVHRVVLLERLGEFRRAAELRTRIEAARTTARGDDWTAAASQERGAAFSESAEEAVEEPPPQKAKANRKAKQHPDIEPGQTPDYSQPTRDNEGPIRQ